MNAQEKEKQQKMIVQNLQGIDTAIKAAVTAKDNHRKTLTDLQMYGTKTYTPQFLEGEIRKENDSFAAKMMTANDDMTKRLEELRTLIRDRDAVLDLSNPAFVGAMMLIQSAGSGLTYEQAVKINANFLHDLSALNAIRDAYLAKGANTGNVEALIYNVDEVIDGLKNLAFEGLVQDGSINTFAVKLGKLATLEGTKVENMPDAQGMDNAWRLAAGLKPV